VANELYEGLEAVKNCFLPMKYNLCVLMLQSAWTWRQKFLPTHWNKFNYTAWKS